MLDVGLYFDPTGACLYSTEDAMGNVLSLFLRKWANKLSHELRRKILGGSQVVGTVGEHDTTLTPEKLLTLEAARRRQICSQILAVATAQSTTIRGFKWSQCQQEK